MDHPGRPQCPDRPGRAGQEVQASDPGSRHQVHRQLRRRVRRRGNRHPEESPRAPRSNAICERAIGELRRELLDRMLIINKDHLHRTLTTYLAHRNEARPHRRLGQLTPAQTETGPPTPTNLANYRIRRTTCRAPILGHQL
ncbi:integrase core domain-containing protein [Catenulispora sp. NL8]|uniref:Integrase core domain-containing protein n=1 Tax=Catenulispora pinistramenti TaxID=2705254 RepID=A0ABS5KR88_9ACTN|nr:integrase core domain-containing protein [Catenulispora pinistramenti]